MPRRRRGGAGEDGTEFRQGRLGSGFEQKQHRQRKTAHKNRAILGIGHIQAKPALGDLIHLHQFDQFGSRFVGIFGASGSGPHQHKAGEDEGKGARKDFREALHCNNGDRRDRREFPQNSKTESLIEEPACL